MGLPVLLAALANPGPQSGTDPCLTPPRWRSGHYNRASLFRLNGFVRCGASLDEPEHLLTLGIALQRIFLVAGEPHERRKRRNPRYVYSVNFAKDRPITAGFDPLSGDIWVRAGLHNLSRPPFCFTNVYEAARRAGCKHFQIE